MSVLKRTAVFVILHLAVLYLFDKAALATPKEIRSDTEPVTINRDSYTRSTTTRSNSDEDAETPTVKIDNAIRPITFTNNGTIIQTFPNPTPSASRPMASAIFFSGSGSNTVTITNNGTISNNHTVTVSTAASEAFAIDANNSTGTVTINNTGEIIGGIRLSKASGNTINFNAGTITGNGFTAIDGRDPASNSDTLNFGGAGTTKTISRGRIAGIENINANAGVAQIWSNILDANLLTVQPGATLILKNSLAKINHVNVNGKMSLIDPRNGGAIRQTITGDFTLGSSGELEIKVSNDMLKTSLLTVTGNVRISDGAKVPVSHSGALNTGKKNQNH